MLSIPTIAGLLQKYDKVKIFIKYFCYNAANIWELLLKNEIPKSF